MSRLTPWPIRSASAGLSRRDLAFAALILIALTLAAAYALWREQQTLRGAGIVIDGDSLRVGSDVIRLEGIDAPELRQTCMEGGQPYRCGDLAKRELGRLIADAALACRIVGQDRYRRQLARCWTGEEADIGAVLVRKGWAVGYRGRYAREEERAKRDKAGLWAGAFERPAEWRQDHMKQP